MLANSFEILLKENIELTGTRTSSLSNPSRPVILILSFRDQMPEKEPLELYISGITTSTFGFTAF